jgi:glycosyltransferase involved in cell wall biosynthesis
MERIENSILVPAVIESRVIPNGIDLTRFAPGEKEAARTRLGLPRDARILLFAAKGVKGGSLKDFATVRDAAVRIGGDLAGRRILLLALGEDAPMERANGAEIRFIPYQDDPDTVADYYRAADLYLHAARAETFPTTILEAMACGRPVVATSVGGIPEQVMAETGVLVPPGDAEAMAAAAAKILANEDEARRLGQGAHRTALDKFDLETQAEAYLSWFREIVDRGPA